MEHADCAALHWNTYVLFAYVLWGGVGKVLSFLKALSNIKLPMSLRTFHTFFFRLCWVLLVAQSSLGVVCGLPSYDVQV